MNGLRLPLALAFLLAALLSLVNVSAYQEGRVTSGSTFTVDSTANAALAISSTNPMALPILSGGVMAIDFREGNGGSRQLRSDATLPDLFQMRDVFRVTNNGSQSQCVSVYVSSGSPLNLKEILGRLSTQIPPGGTQLAGANGAQTPNRVLLAPSAYMFVDFTWEARGVATASNFVVSVTSANQGSCP